MILKAEDITPAIMVVNEEYWIYYVLRDLLKAFGKAVVIDTGSTDATPDLVVSAGRNFNGEVILIKENFSDAVEIGNCRNVMRNMIKTHWMFLVDGDEIWRPEQLDHLIGQEVPDHTGVVMVGGKNIEERDGKLMVRSEDLANYDRLFAPGIKWNRTDYPFEGYGLGDHFPQENVAYFDANKAFHWHMRHTIRSRDDSSAFFRQQKRGYFPYDGKYVDMPENWLGEIYTDVRNPYVNPGME